MLQGISTACFLGRDSVLTAGGAKWQATTCADDPNLRDEDELAGEEAALGTAGASAEAQGARRTQRSCRSCPLFTQLCLKVLELWATRTGGCKKDLLHTSFAGSKREAQAGLLCMTQKRGRRRRTMG